MLLSQLHLVQRKISFWIFSHARKLNYFVYSVLSLLDASIEETNDGKQKYIIEPGGGANYAEVIIDLNMVTIYVSWS